TVVQISAGDFIFMGDVVQTGSDSAATIKLIDGTTFDISADCISILDGLSPNSMLTSASQKPIQVAMSDVSTDDDEIKPFGIYTLTRADDPSFFRLIDNPNEVVEVSRGSSGQFIVTNGASDPVAQALYYRGALETKNLGAQYGINPNSPGSGTPTDLLFIQPIKFSSPLDTAPTILLNQSPQLPPILF